MCQAWTSASFQRQKTSWVWFFTFCFLSNPDLIAATVLLASPAAGSEASLGLGSSGRWTSSWKWFVWDYFSFKFSSPRGSKISSWATYCRKTQNTEGACVFSKAKLSSSSARGAAPPSCDAAEMLELSIPSPSAAMKWLEGSQTRIFGSQQAMWFKIFHCL